MRIVLKPAFLTAVIIAFVVLTFPHAVSCARSPDIQSPILSREFPRFQPIFKSATICFAELLLPDVLFGDFFAAFVTVTVHTALYVVSFIFTVIFAVPAFTAVTTPFLTVATDLSDELH